jgi:putative aldouronate transport system substrate-binding protein
LKKKWGYQAVTVLLIMVFMAAGCSTGANNSGSGSSVTDQTGSNDSNKGSAPTEAPAESANPLAQRHKITIFNPGLNADAPHGTKDQDPVWQKIDEKFNVDLEIIMAPEQAEAKLNALIASGAMPDIVFTNRAGAIKYHEQGVVLTLDDYLDDVPALRDRYDQNRWQQMMYKGETLGVPGIEDVTGKNGYWIRNDWLNNLNLKAPTTAEELLDVMRAFTFDDPDGNGKNDTYGFIGGLTKEGVFTLGLDKLFWLFGVYPNHVDVVDNQIVYHNTDPRMKEAFAYVSTIINEKLIDPDYVTNSIFATHEEKMFKARAGIIIHDWRRMEPSFQEQMKEISGEVPDWITIEPPKGPRGDQWLDVDAFQSNIISISKKTSDDPDKALRVMQVLEYMFTDQEIYPMMSYGVKDIDWIQEGDSWKLLEGFYQTDRRWYKHWSFVRKGDDMVYFSAENPKTHEYWSLNQKYMYPNNVKPFLVDNDPLAVDRNKYMNEMLLKFASGKESVEKFDDFIHTLESKFQLNELLDNFTQQLKDVGSIK